MVPQTFLTLPWRFPLARAADSALFFDAVEFWLGWFTPGTRSAEREQILGSLLGLCLGDALGFVVEGHAAPVAREYVEEILRSGQAGSVGRSPHDFGQYTDDSQLTRELVLSIAECRGFEPEDYARRIATLFAEQRVVGRGQATAEAAARLVRGIPWHKAGAPAPNAGNGAAMRAAPIGWLFPDDETRLVLAARDQALITHADPRAIAGSVVIAATVAQALRCGPALDPDRLISHLARLVERLDQSFATALLRLRDWRHRTPDDALWLISRAGLAGAAAESPWWPGEEGSISPFVIPSVLWSLYAFLRSPGDYWETICTAISGGGDTDTTAAMAGAISGAALGLKALPERLWSQLGDCGEWDSEALIALGSRFHAGRAGARTRVERTLQ